MCIKDLIEKRIDLYYNDIEIRKNLTTDQSTKLIQGRAILRELYYLKDKINVEEELNYVS